MKTIIFTGCSFTAGNGWAAHDLAAEDKNCTKLWVNLCGEKINWKFPCQVINAGQGGASNTEIFQNTVDAMTNPGLDIDTVFCQWTAGPRYNFTVGFELWNTQESFIKDRANTCDINLHDGTHYPKEYIKDLIDRFRSLHHVHWEILSIVKYSNILTNMAKKIGCNIFFINGLCPWDKDYFVELNDVDPESYTTFTKKYILDIDARPDEDIRELYHLAHGYYNQAGGVNESNWINLYDSLLQNRTDFNYDQTHPGEQSNWNYYKMIETRLRCLHYMQ